MYKAVLSDLKRRSLVDYGKKHQNRSICEKNVRCGLKVEFCMLFHSQAGHRLCQLLYGPVLMTLLR